MDPDLLRIERKIDRLLKQQQEKKMWVKSAVISSLTGWDHEQMRTARENGYVIFQKKEKDGRTSFFYDLNSLHERFIK